MFFCGAALLIVFLLPTASHADDAASDPGAETSRWVTSIAPLGSSGHFVAGTANSLLLREASVVSFDPDTPNEWTTLYSHPAAVWCVAATGDGGTIASVDYRGNLVLFDRSSEQATTHEKAFERWCQALTLSPDEELVVAGNEEGKVLVWDIKANKVSKSIELDGHAVTGIDFSPDGQRLAASDGSGHVHLLQWPGLKSSGKIKVSDEPAWCVAFAEGGTKLLVGCGDRKLYECVVKPDAKPESIADGSDWITGIAISPTGQIAAAEVGGRVLFPSGGRVDSMNAESGVWAVQWNGDAQLLVGTRKNGIAAASRSWKWSGPKDDEGGAQ